MIILSHRGYWKTEPDKNTHAAFVRSFTLGFGTETDVRDSPAGLVISHDPPRGGEMPLTDFLRLLPNPDLPLAMNVKADGLAKPLKAAMDAAGHRNWFAFDMSIPDTVQQLRAEMPVFLRVSEYEPWPPGLLQRAAGVWLDAFEGDWWCAADVEAMLEAAGRVCIVSPELHRRPHLDAWARLAPLAGRPGLMLCSDLPEDARAFFQGGSA